MEKNNITFGNYSSAIAGIIVALLTIIISLGVSDLKKVTTHLPRRHLRKVEGMKTPTRNQKRDEAPRG